MKMTREELLRRGGKWLGAARNWLQWRCHNQDNVTWGSSVELRPPMTYRDVDELAAEVAATFWPEESAPKSVIDAARALTRWHYGGGRGQGECAPADCVLVAREDWRALQQALREMPTDGRDLFLDIAVAYRNKKIELPPEIVARIAAIVGGGLTGG